MAYKYSAAELSLAAEQASSVAQMLRLLGLKSSGGRRASIQAALYNYSIDTSHFCRIAWTKYSAELLAEAACACPNCHSQTETFAGRNRARLRKPAVIL